MPDFARLDQKYIWHPFTQMRDWLRGEPIVIAGGQGAVLRDTKGRQYLDANSSIWTNLHGHNHPRIDSAINAQLKKIAHSSALGLANEPASLLAQELIKAATPAGRAIPCPALSKVFFSDDGSTAMEVALKLAYEYSRRTGRSQKPKFLALEGGYHGDTVGAVSLGHIDLFHKAYSGLLFKTDKVPAPYCYRCRFNRAKPERADARAYRKCHWECLEVLEQKFQKQKKKGNAYAGFVVEPLVQGAAGMIPQPPGWLRQATIMARNYNALLIADEVMTGFGRTGTELASIDSKTGANKRPLWNQTLLRDKDRQHSPALFACQHEGVQADFLALAKGLTGGYLPMAATLTTQSVFDAFLGQYEEFKTFFHGHSYTANQLGAAAALANLEMLNEPASIRARARLQRCLEAELKILWRHPNVGDIRQIGLMVGVELVRDWRTRGSFDLRERAGARVCDAMAKRGVLTRPIGNVIVIMPPYCTTNAQLHRIIRTLSDAIKTELSR